jgi:heat shock protein HtpX
MGRAAAGDQRSMTARRPIPTPSWWHQALMLSAFALAVALVLAVVGVVAFVTWWLFAHDFGVVSLVLLVILLVFVGAGLGAGRRQLRGDGTRDEAQEARVGAILDRLCVMADVARLDVRVPGGLPPLSWTTQWPWGSATITVTKSLAEELDDPQLEAAVAHELGHLANGDAWIMTIVAGPSSVLLSGLWKTWTSFNRATPFVVICTMWMAPFLLVSMLLGRVVSRQRELAADRAAVALTGSAATLSATLLRLNGSLEKRRRRDLRTVAAADVFHLLPVRDPKGLRRLWATHPPLAARLEALERLERHIQG